jgi:hypothetical protein
MRSLLYSILTLLLALCSSQDLTQRKLDKHGAGDSMVRSIHGMTASGIKKDQIQKNLQNHFPEKSLHELNDLIVVANAASGRRQPKDQDNKKATAYRLKHTKEDFDRKLKKFNAR